MPSCSIACTPSMETDQVSRRSEKFDLHCSVLLSLAGLKLRFKLQSSAQLAMLQSLDFHLFFILHCL